MATLRPNSQEQVFPASSTLLFVRAGGRAGVLVSVGRITDKSFGLICLLAYVYTHLYFFSYLSFCLSTCLHLHPHRLSSALGICTKSPAGQVISSFPRSGGRPTDQVRPRNKTVTILPMLPTLSLGVQTTPKFLNSRKNVERLIATRCS